MTNKEIFKWISPCFTLFLSLIPVANAQVNNIYSDPSLERFFATRPVDASSKADISKVLDNLHAQYLNETDTTFKKSLLTEITNGEPQSPSSQVEETRDRFITWTTQCLTKYAMEKLDSSGLFTGGSQLPKDVLDKPFFENSTDVCYVRANAAYTLDRINRADAKRRQANMKSVNDVLLNGNKYDRGIYVSGFFLYDQRGPSLLLHSQGNINRIYVNTGGLEGKNLRKVMECSLGCNLQFLGRVDTYYRQYIINAIQVYDAPN